MLKKVYILVNHSNLELILSNLLEIIGFLPIVITELDFTNKKLLKEKDKNILFTNYYYIHNNIQFLDLFKNVIVFIPYGESFINTNINTNSQIILFSKALTVNNIKNLLKKSNLIL